MMLKTILALGAGVALYFMPHVNNKLIFLPIVIISSLIPEIGMLIKMKPELFARTQNSNFIDKILKNYIVCILASVILAFSYSMFALPFFLGYSFTLSLNAFSKEGIQPFWPLTSKKTSGSIVTGGGIERTLFYVFLVFDIALLVKLFL